MSNDSDIDTEENPDFIACAGCGGEFYYGDLIDELCADCIVEDDDA